MSEHNKCTEHCVCTAVRKVDDAQKKVAEQTQACTFSCEQSVADLLAPWRMKPTRKTTIPFILYCKGSCKPFIAETIEHTKLECFDKKWYRSVKSPFLKVKKMLPGSKCCAVIEILLPCNANGMPLHSRGDRLSDYLQDEAPFKTIQFRETGICLTIDLDDFSGIRCLKPTTPLEPL